MQRKWTVFPIVLAGLGSLLAAWQVSDTFQRLVFWSLLIWLLLEVVEAALDWERHPWRTPADRPVGWPWRRGLEALLLLAAFALAGLGVGIAQTALGSDMRDVPWAVISVFALLAAVAVAWLGFTSRRSGVEHPGLHTSNRGIDR